MNIKEFIEKLECVADGMPKGMDTEVFMANMYGKENLKYGTGFFEGDEKGLVLISSYYHYILKYTEQGEHKETDPILFIEDIYSFINSEGITDFCVWEVTNGVGRIIDSNKA